MQRGAATSPSSSPATPEERGGKRQRLSNGSYNASPASTPGGANNAEEQRRQEIAEREGVAKGDTKWYLSVQPASKPVAESPLRIVSAGYSTLDAPARRNSAAEDEPDDVSSNATAAGRMNFGNFRRKQMVCSLGYSAMLSLLSRLGNQTCSRRFRRRRGLRVKLRFRL